MSLNITSEITTRDGFVLPTSYGRSIFSIQIILQMVPT